MRFVDRTDAGRQLGTRLGHLRGTDAVVLGLPRGGVVVAKEVACALNVPLDVLVVRKLGVPWQPELAMGAVAEGGIVVVDEEVIRSAGISREEFDSVRRAEQERVARLVQQLRSGRAPTPLAGRTVVIVDDGIATGSTAIAASRAVRAQGPAHLVLAVPVVAPNAIQQLEPEVDELVWLAAPSAFFGVGGSYSEFSQTTDAQVARCLTSASDASAATNADAPAPPQEPSEDRDVTVEAGDVGLSGHLAVPASATGLVLFAHGSGSSAASPRNRAVAATLHASGIGTLLFDLLAPHEAHDRRQVFDVELLADRLRGATRWVRAEPSAKGAALGYFGASTGAAAALVAAADPVMEIRAVVSRGGRIDLAGAAIGKVRAPTLLIVGGRDRLVLELSRRALAAFTCERRLEVVGGATHLFEEPGAMDAVAGLAAGWFGEHLLGVKRAA